MSGCNNGLHNCITPLPMDASGKMSDYEFLCWIQTNMTNLLKEYGELSAAWKALQEWVTDYFDNLDVQQEINNKINDMISDGSLSEIIEPFIAEYQNPIFVDSTSEMTEQNKTYVLTSNGHIYTWNGSEYYDTGLIYGISGMEYTFRGVIVQDSSLTQSYTLSDYVNTGYYASGSLGNASFTDYPPFIPLQPFVLENNTLITTTGAQQTFQTFKSTGSGMAYRLITASGINEWVVIMDEYQTLIYRGEINDGSEEYNLANYIEAGYYISGSVRGITISDYPANMPLEPFYLLSLRSTEYSTLQIIYTRSIYGFIAFRIITASNAGRWVNLYGMYRGILPYVDNAITLSSITYTSVYASGSLSGKTITDAPVGFSPFMLYTQEIETTQWFQFVYDTTGHFAYRFYNTNWYYFGEIKSTLTQGENVFSTDEGSPTEATLSNYRENGWYISGTVSGKIVTDFPCLLSNFVLIVFKTAETACLQILFTTNGNGPYYRYINNQNIGVWYPFNSSPTIQWASFGDSIADGTYSEEDGSKGTSLSASYIYLCNLWNMKNYFTNYADSGMGYNRKGASGYNVCELIDTLTDLANYDLITVALGINDYRGGTTLGDENSTVRDGTLSGNCRYVIETILSKNTKCKLVLISPMNTILNSNTNQSTKYAFNYANGNAGTLLEIRDMLKYWADYYMIGFADMTENGVINLYNISECLPDNVHPSQYTHEQLARTLANKLKFM